MIKKNHWYQNKKILVSFIGIFIIGLMVLSTLNIIETQDKTNKIKYKNYSFTKQNDQWITYINNKAIAFKYNPLELENTIIPNYNFYISKLYLAYDPIDISNEQFIIQRAGSILQYFNIRPVLSCISEKDCPDIPLINCKNNDALYLKYSNDTKVYIEDKCLVIQGTPDQQLMYLDKVFYNLLGI
ncbi:MAG: hypothetical protein PHF86_10800 [Candidatus Nanoarchaeia archaeon]|nr:hypothetical protein [Candidatus Nanoarchaeia archaeon]